MYSPHLLRIKRGRKKDTFPSLEQTRYQEMEEEFTRQSKHLKQLVSALRKERHIRKSH